MPLSTADGRGWIYDRIAQIKSPTIIDGGAGEGTYSVLGRHLRLEANWVAVEIHEPYVDRFLLEHKYDEVLVGDLRGYEPEGPYTILLGDVLEHMKRAEAIEVLAYHLEHADEIMVSVPIVYAPQEGCYGNDHEAHLYHWHFEEMLDLLPGAESFRGVQVGRYWWRKQ